MIIFGNSDNAIVKGIKDINTKTVNEGKDYVRIRAGLYFLNDFSPNELSRFLGNGVPYSDHIGYGKSINFLNRKRGFFLEDVGFIAVYAMFGILAVIAFIIIWIYSFKFQLRDELYYLKYYLWFLLITSMTSLNVYHPYFLISTVFVLYIYQTQLYYLVKQ